MTYRVEYSGSDIEIATLDAAVDAAKHAILADVGPVSGWNVEHDDTINDWFVQGVRNGEPVGSTAVVTGPEPVGPPDDLLTAPGRGPARPLSPAPMRAQHEHDQVRARHDPTQVQHDVVQAQHERAQAWQVYGSARAQHERVQVAETPVSVIVFAGISATEVFGMATAWLAGQSGAVEVEDVSWRDSAAAVPNDAYAESGYAADSGAACYLRLYYRSR